MAPPSPPWAEPQPMNKHFFFLLLLLLIPPNSSNTSALCSCFALKARTSLQAAHPQKHTHTHSCARSTLALELPLLKVKTLWRSRQGCFASFVILCNPLHTHHHLLFRFAILFGVPHGTGSRAHHGLPVLVPADGEAGHTDPRAAPGT